MFNSSSSSPYDTTTSLAEKLNQHKPTVIAFLSPYCGLCRALSPKLSTAEAEGVPVARVNSLDARTWAPEMLAYDVEAVPCLVLLDSKGRAVAKSNPPTSTEQMLAALESMLASPR